MRKLLRYIITGLMTATLLLGQTTVSMAAPEDRGPAFDPALQGNTSVSETQGENSEAPSSSGETVTEAPTGTSGSGAVTNPDGTETTPGETAAPETGTPEAGTPEAGTPEAGTPETAPTEGAEVVEDNSQAAAPHIQVQFMDMAGNWSQPVISGQTLEVGNDGFRSVCIYLNNIVGNVIYRTYVSAHGWSEWCMNGQQTTIWEDSAPVEAVQIRLSGYAKNKFDLYYYAILSDGSTLDWAANGQTSGTMANGKIMTGIRTTFWGKDDPNPWPYSTANPVSAAASDGVNTANVPATYSSGTGAVYTGWGWNDSDKYYFVDNQAVTGWQYIDGYKYYFDETGKIVSDLDELIGKQENYYIKINKQMNTMTIYASDGENGYIIPVKSFLCSTGDDTPLGEHVTPEKYRWRLMNTDEYCQYCTRLGSGLSILMHSVIYELPNVHTLKANTYNYLGANKSHGCIRLVTKDAKWIYENCKIGTRVFVYESSVPGPYERPAIEWVIPSDQDYDPTDVEAL